MNTALFRISIILLPTILMASPTPDANAQPYAAARYNQVDGSLYAYLTTDISVLSFNLNEDLFDFGGNSPMLGSLGPVVSAPDVVAFFSATGLPTGLFNVGSGLPTGLSPTVIRFVYTPIGAEAVEGTLDAISPESAASAKYNPVSGALVVNILSSAQAILLETPGLFNTGTNPLLGSMAPSQFDASNLMFFNNDAPLPAGTFNLGAVLPPGLTASQISLATKGDGIAVGIPVTVVPEPGAVALAAIGLSLVACRIRRSAM